MNVEHFSLTGIFIFCIIYLYLFAVVCRTDPIFAFSRKIGGKGIPLLKFSEDLIMKKFKEFFVSYWELTKESGRWMKEHWLGYTILCIVITLWQFRGLIWRKIELKMLDRKWKKMEDSSKEEESN